MGGPHDGKQITVADHLWTIAMPVDIPLEARFDHLPLEEIPPSVWVARYERRSQDDFFATYIYTGQEQLW